MPSLFRRRGRPPHPDVLTPAEWRVVDEVRKGRTNPEIAEALGLSANTVKTHVSSILAKLDFSGRDQLTTWEGQPAATGAGRASSPGPAWAAFLLHGRAGAVAKGVAGVLLVVAIGLVARAAVGSARGGGGAGAPPTASPAATVEPGAVLPPPPAGSGHSAALTLPAGFPVGGFTLTRLPNGAVIAAGGIVCDASASPPAARPTASTASTRALPALFPPVACSSRGRVRRRCCSATARAHRGRRDGTGRVPRRPDVHAASAQRHARRSHAARDSPSADRDLDCGTGRAPDACWQRVRTFHRGSLGGADFGAVLPDGRVLFASPASSSSTRRAGQLDACAAFLGVTRSGSAGSSLRRAGRCSSTAASTAPRRGMYVAPAQYPTWSPLDSHEGAFVQVATLPLAAEAAATLDDGRVLVLGGGVRGTNGALEPLTQDRVRQIAPAALPPYGVAGFAYQWLVLDPASGSVRRLGGPLPADGAGQVPGDVALTALPGGGALLVGGDWPGGITATPAAGGAPSGAWFVDTRTGALTALAPLRHGYLEPQAVALQDGSVLVIGDDAANTAHPTVAEVYSPQ